MSRRGAARKAALLAAFLAARPARGELLSGYIKDLYQSERSFLTDQPLDQNLIRARLQLDERAGQDGWLGVYAAYDQEVLTGSFLSSPDRKLFGVSGPPTWLDLSWNISDQADHLWLHRFYRLYAEAAPGPWLVRFGRQRIAWGTGKLWNPTDVLNPYQPLTVERDERLGVDSLYVKRALTDLSQAEAAYAPMDSWAQSSLLGRVHLHPAETDLSFMGGKPAGGEGIWMVGGDAAKDVGGNTAHAEWSYTGGIPEPYWRYLVGYEATLLSPGWLKDAWLLAEYYHNGAGAFETSRYDFLSLLSGRSTSVGRDYVGLGFRRELHPLFQVEAYWISNLRDGSWFAGPAADFNALPNLHLSAGWQALQGGPQTEFGRPSNIAYAQAQYYY